MRGRKVLFTDGEGPIVFKDLAFDVTNRITFPDYIPGHEFFPVLSLYDDYQAEVGTEGYQAGDTLALVVPHWLAHVITDRDILEESREAQLVQGVKEYTEGLKNDDWQIRIISTSYRPLWNLVGQHLGIPQEHIACTELDLSRLKNQHYSPDFAQTVSNTEQQIISLMPQFLEAKQQVEEGRPVQEVFSKRGPAAQIREVLDRLYWQELPRLGYQTLEAVRVMGGRRKVEAAQRFAADLQVPFKAIAYVGDSITDDEVHKFLRSEKGLPIAINANFYALRNARVAVAATDAHALRPLLNAWVEGGWSGVVNFVEGKGQVSLRKEMVPPGEGVTEFYYHLVDPKNEKEFQEILRLHKIFRKKVRGGATAALG